MLRRIVLAALSGCAVLAAACGGLRTASAIEVRCIEASRYKHLYRIFGNDRRKFADYLQVDAADLPDGEVCRAVVVTGRIEASSASKQQGATPDADQLVQAIAESRGWLAAVYLASPGGNIGTGLVLAQIVRMFWLKVEAPGAASFTYWPDFVPRNPAADGTATWPELAKAEVPSAFASAWPDYARAVGSVAQVTLAGKQRGRCASACTFAHVAGIERHGTVYVHRGRPGKGAVKDRSMAQILEGLHRAETRIIALYRSMDGGEDFVRLFQDTPTATVRPALAARYPRYIFDLLLTRCGGASEALLAQEGKLRAALESGVQNPRDEVALERLKKGLPALRAKRAAVERCAAAQHEKERLAQYGRFCGGACNRSLIVSTVNARLRELGPPSSAPPAKALPSR